MTSSVSREEMEDEVRRAGVRDPRAAGRLLRIIEAYARKPSAQEEPPPLLSPGEWDKAAEVTMCKECVKLKSWDHFHADRQHPTGRKTTCRNCVRRNAETGRHPGQWKCPACDDYRDPGDFPQSKRDNPRRPVPCISCGKKIP